MGSALIRLAYDVGEGIGLGHQRRMEALAAGLHGLGLSSELAAIGDGVEGDVVVVDSYVVRADGDAVRARRRVAIDDLERDLAVDVLVDPAPLPPCGRDERARAGTLLRGPGYALLDPALARREVRPVGDEVGTVLVATGGADAGGVGASIAAGLLYALPDVAVRLVVGPWSSDAVPEGVDAVRAPSGLADDLAAADLVVCSAGVTLLEALVLGRPVVAALTADNQRRSFDGLVAAGAAEGCESPDAAVAAAVGLAGDVERRRVLATRGREVVDGQGAGRVAEAVAALV